MSDLSVVKQFSMPPPMHFKEEGGASLSPDGTKFIAVCKSGSYVIIYFSDLFFTDTFCIFSHPHTY